jgi:hypothetical protein
MIDIATPQIITEKIYNNNRLTDGLSANQPNTIRPTVLDTLSHSGVKHQSINQSHSGSCHSTCICQDGQNKMKCRFLDSSLFSNGVFVLFCFSNVCLYFGYITPALLLPHHAQENGISVLSST